jgi:hypothetical protein
MTEKWKCPKFSPSENTPISATDYFFDQHEDWTTQGARRIVPDKKFREDLAAMVNEILDADRAQRGDPRLAELQRLAREKQSIRAIDNVSGHSDENDDRYVANEVSIRTALDRLAAAPTIDPSAPMIPDTPEGRKRAMVEAVIAAMKGNPT